MKTGSIASMPLAPAPDAMVKPSTPPPQVMVPKVEVLRPSIQASSCLAEMTGTPRALAEVTIAAACASVLPSAWMFAVNAP